MILFLLSGCGSDSKPGGTAGGEKEKAAASAKTGKQMPVPLVMEEEIAPGEAGKRSQAKKEPSTRRIEVLRGMTKEELEAKAEESMAEMKKAQKFRGPVIGGMTQEDLEAKAEESRKRLELKGGGEIFPGITQQELERMAAQGQRREPTPMQEMFPGLTKEQVDASARSRIPEHREMFPPSGGK